MQEESERASRVKREKPILVILGNPPYNGLAGVAQDEEQDLLKPYFAGLAEYDVQVRGLNDLYVRFFRLAERRIGEVGKRGIISLISNFSWLDGQSHPIMRKRLLDTFDAIWIDNCNGDKYRTGKRTPDGKPDQSMFTTDTQAVGIQVGTAIATMVKRGESKGSDRTAVVHYRDLWGFSNDKRQQLLRSLDPNAKSIAYVNIEPLAELRYILTPGGLKSGYGRWPRLTDFFIDYYPGVQTSRDELVVDIDRERLISSMRDYFDPAISDESIAERWPGAMKEGNRFPAKKTRQRLVSRGFLPENVVRFSYRPFDDRWLYWEPEGKLLDEKRSDYFPQVFPKNIALIASAAIRKGAVDGPTPIVHLGCRHLVERGANVFPMLHRSVGSLDGGVPTLNISDKILSAISSSYHIAGLTEKDLAENVFFHIFAVLWSPLYRRENEAALRQDWSRIPIPAEPAELAASAELGRRVADLLLPDTAVPGVTTGNLRSELRTTGIPTKAGGGTIDPDADLKVDAGWGFFGARNAVMCGKGRLTPSLADPQHAVDVYINPAVFWGNVPSGVWGMMIGGYPVIKKWLSYREFKVLGRSLQLEEMTYITEVIRRLKALLLLGSDLDANYLAIAGHTLDLANNSEVEIEDSSEE